MQVIEIFLKQSKLLCLYTILKNSIGIWSTQGHSCSKHLVQNLLESIRFLFDRGKLSVRDRQMDLKNPLFDKVMNSCTFGSEDARIFLLCLGNQELDYIYIFKCINIVIHAHTVCIILPSLTQNTLTHYYLYLNG